MKTKQALILRNSTDKQKIDNLKRFSCDVLFSTNFDNIEQCTEENYKHFCEENKYESLLILNEDEDIKFFDSSFSFNYVCITDGEWIIKPRRVYNICQKYSLEGMPCILKKNNALKGIKVDESFEFFKKLYQEKQFKQFVLEIEKWFFHNFKNYSKNVMLRYYATVIYLMKLNDARSGIIQLTQALMSHPQHSELWCLWGDHLVQSKKYHEAYHIYETALSAGKLRNIYDENPVWLKKYDVYPKDMMSKIKHLCEKTKIFEIRTQDPVH